MAAPDGYTIHLTSVGPMSVAPHLVKDLPYDPRRDIAPITMGVIFPNVIVVHSGVPAKTLAEFVALAKQKPGKLTYASSGVGGAGHLAGELFKERAGIDMLHVPYRSDGAAITDLVGGRVQVYFVALAGAAGFIKDGKVRALAVTTAERSAAFPEVPAIGEFVPGYEASLRNGIGAPKGTPADIIEKVNTEINAGLNDHKIKSQFAALGSETVPLTTAEYGKIIVEETEKWGKVIRAANIKAQ